MSKITTTFLYILSDIAELAGIACFVGAVLIWLI